MSFIAHGYLPVPFDRADLVGVWQTLEHHDPRFSNTQ
jgi:hypothetical protein